MRRSSYAAQTGPLPEAPSSNPQGVPYALLGASTEPYNIPTTMSPLSIQPPLQKNCDARGLHLLL